MSFATLHCTRLMPFPVADLAKDSENPEIIRVTYHPYGKPDERWSRPLVMFEETIERDGKKFRRFEPVSILISVE